MSRMRICFAVLASLATIAQSAEWVPGQTYFQGDTVELDWSAWTLVVPSNAGWEQLPPYSASLFAVWRLVSIDTCARAWESGGAYVQNQVVLDSGRLWRLELPSNAGWENWRPQSAFLWAVWSDAGPWEDYGGCLSPSDRDSDGVPDIVGAILETNGDISLFGHPDRWFVDDSNRTVVYDFSSVPGYEGSDSVPLVLPPPIDPPTPSFLKPVPIFSVVTASQRNLPRVPEGYHFIGPEIRISFLNETVPQARLVTFPLPDRARSAPLSDVLAFVHEGDTSWASVPVLYYGNRNAIIRLYGTTAIRFAVKEKDVVWSPGYEQTNFVEWASNPGDETFNRRKAMSNSPTFFSEGAIKSMLSLQSPIGTTGWVEKMGAYQNLVIRPAIEKAATLGINTIDFTFYADSAAQGASNCPSDGSDCYNLIRSIEFRQWVSEIRRHNNRVPGRPIRMRIRLYASPLSLKSFFAHFQDTVYCGNSTACPITKTDLAELEGRYRANNLEAGSFGKPDAVVLNYFNLRDDFIRRFLKIFYRIAIDEVQAISGNDIEIDAVTLVLDADGETGLSLLKADDSIAVSDFGRKLTAPILAFPSDTAFNGGIFQSSWWEQQMFHYDSIMSFFKDRVNVLRDAYSDFAQTVGEISPAFTAKERLVPAIFYEDWLDDALYRGALNGYDLVRNSGIRLYHHCMFPVPARMQRATQAFTLGIRNAINLLATSDTTIRFDTEMSWAHWDKRIITDGGARDTALGDSIANKSAWWERDFLTAENANNFRDQADVAIQADAAGYVLCNWSIQDLLDGSSNKADDEEPTRTAWERILGNEGDEHVYGANGTVSTGPDTVHRRVALYISDPVALLTRLSGDWMDMLYGTWNWYDSPGGWFGKLMRFCDERCELAVVNDAMILDTEGAILDLYDEIWIAYPDTNSRPGVRDSCIARTERGEAFGYLRAHFAPKPAPSFPIELHPATF